ncbi:alcohol dehydrogenase catalytic domain-containing protein [Psychrobacillus sp. L3]|uniref:alcohol dehydrogenase catalytic domain-containing protein n=1 Tax=Psychrobacillus sp. L3 TaxID=3236891 RepID=UPI0036F33182
MLSKAFKVVEPKRFDLYLEDLNITDDEVLVKVDYMSICKADLRYYDGNRDEKTLALKYPISLIHEATGIVVKDNSNVFEIGTRVVLIPNEIKKKCDMNCVCQDKQLGENYCPNANFASSNTDGFSKGFVKISSKQIIQIDEQIPSNIAVFSEMISVACAAIRRKENLFGNIGIWGDGILGYILASTIKTLHPDAIVIAVGKHKEKLDQFRADKSYLIHEKINEKFDFVFECVGGRASSNAINQSIDYIKVGGSLILAGVTEELVPINTRKILEKGISITGTTRSQKEDFEKAQALLNDKQFIDSIKKLQLSENIIYNINDYYMIFEEETKNKKLGKHLMKFNI